MATVLDAFAGCGGASCGWEMAGFEIKYAIDNDEKVEETFKKNHPKTEFILEDITKLDPRDYSDVDVVIGSPPCNLISVANQKRDPKEGMKLVNHFRKWIDVIKPRYWIMENVAIIKDHLKRSRYPVIKVLNSANYGVPQARERCFSGMYVPPRPTHTRRAMMTLDGEKLEKWITVRESIRDLIEIPVDAVLTDQMGNRPKANSPYFSPDQPSRTVTTVPMRVMKKSDMYDKKKDGDVENHVWFDNLKEYKFDHVNREIKLDKPSPTITTKFCCAQKINVGKNGKTAFRRLTVRETARLQSFPDDFKFYGSLLAQYGMIGRAVPPIMAYHLARPLKKVFGMEK